MFPVRYELNSYINLLRNSVFKGLIHVRYNDNSSNGWGENDKDPY
jgi:hypothetical protein